MPIYVISPEVALRLAKDNVVLSSDIQLLAPTLMRSQLLAMLYGMVHQGDMSKQDAEHYLGCVRGYRIRLLGDRVLQSVAWNLAEQLGWPDTFDAEYVALTKLQGDAFVTLDNDLATAVADIVHVASYEALLNSDITETE